MPTREIAKSSGTSRYQSIRRMSSSGRLCSDFSASSVLLVSAIVLKTVGRVDPRDVPGSKEFGVTRKRRH